MPIFLQRMTARPRLKLDSANPAYEHEADRVSAAIAPTWRALTAQLKSAGDRSANARRPYFGVDHQRSTLFQADAGREVPFRARMEAAFGEDFSSVRAQVGQGAALDAMGAEAAAADDKVAFASPNPDPARVAHELAHVVQQRRGAVRAPSAHAVVESPAFEAEADAAAGATAAGHPVPALSGRRASDVQRPPGAGAVQLDKKKTPSPIVYVGMTENAPAESKKLTAVNPDRGGVTTITTTDPQDVLTAGATTFDLTAAAEIEAFAKSLGLAADREKKVADLLKTQDPNGKDELAALIKVYVATEADPGTPRMTRVVLSGHSGGLTFFGKGGRIAFETLVKLAEIFPKAAGQVEHLHMSGCSTGGESTIEDFYVKAFPNVKTIWAYAGACPTGSSALTALKTWEGLTEREGVKKLPKQGGGVATWSEGKYEGGEALSLAEALARVSTQESLFDEYFNGLKTDASPESGPLTDHYRLVVRVLGRRDLPVADKTRLRERQQIAMRLRFYTNVRGHFVDAHSATIRAGYDALKLTMPDFKKLSRKEALKAIKEFGDAAAGGGDPITKALDLLQNGLRNLSPTEIKDDWIL